MPRSLACSAAAAEEELPGPEGVVDEGVASGSDAEAGGDAGASAGGVAAAGEVSFGLPPESRPSPPPPPVSGAGTGAGDSTAAGTLSPASLGAGPPPPPCSLEVRLPSALAAGRGCGVAGAVRPSVTASATDASWAGPLGSGAGESSGKPAWASIATTIRPAAAVRPRKAKAVVRSRSGRPLPAKLSRSEENRLLSKIERTTSHIDAEGLPKSKWLGFLDFRFGYLSTRIESPSTSMTTSPSSSVRHVGTPCPARVTRVPGVGCP